MEKNISQEFIARICELYNDIYDDRVENTCPPTAGNSPCTPPWPRLDTGVARGAQIPVSFPAGTAGDGDLCVYIEDQEDPYHRRLLDYSAQQEDPEAVFPVYF